MRIDGQKHGLAWKQIKGEDMKFSSEDLVFLQLVVSFLTSDEFLKCLNSYQPEDFTIWCDKEAEFGTSKRSRDECVQCYYIDVVTKVNTFYTDETIFAQEDFIYLKNDSDFADATIWFYYPYDFPALVRLNSEIATWCCDTVDIVAMNKRGWVELKPSQKLLNDESEVWEQGNALWKRELYKRYRETVMILSKENVQALQEATLALQKTGKYSELANKMYHLAQNADNYNREFCLKFSELRKIEKKDDEQQQQDH